MILINFSHPLTPAQREELETRLGKPVERIIEIPAPIDPQRPLAPQIVALADRAGLTSAEWQSQPLLINPPALNFSAVVLLAELHGRCGYFPAHLRMRPVQGSLPPQYEIAEILNLQALRDEARKQR